MFATTEKYVDLSGICTLLKSSISESFCYQQRLFSTHACYFCVLKSLNDTNSAQSNYLSIFEILESLLKKILFSFYITILVTSSIQP